MPSKVAGLVSTPNGTPGSSTSTHTWMLPAPSSTTYGWLFRQPSTVWVFGITAREEKNTVSLWHEPRIQHISADLTALQYLLPPAPRKRSQTAGHVDIHRRVQ